jgi:hypothetical protein
LSDYDVPTNLPIETSAEPVQVAPLALPDGAVELVEWEDQLRPVVREARISEEAYVEAQREQTRLMMQRGVKDPDGKRMQRTEDYARWRYRGYQVGEVASL